MKKLGWLIAIFFSLNVYSYVGEDLSEGSGNIEIQILDTIGSIEQLLKNVNHDLNNCESDIPNIPRTELDVFFTVTGLSGLNKFGQGRECLEQRLKSVTTQICQAKEDVYTQAQRYRNYDQRYERVQNGVDRIEDAHRRHQEWLQDQADRFYNRAEGHGDSSMYGNELRAYADIFETESYISCPYGQFNRSSRGRNSSSRGYY